MCLHFKKDETRYTESLSSVIFHKRIMVGRSDSEDSLAELKPPHLSSLLWVEAEIHIKLFTLSWVTWCLPIHRVWRWARNLKRVHMQMSVLSSWPPSFWDWHPLYCLSAAVYPDSLLSLFDQLRPRASLRVSAILHDIDRSLQSEGRPMSSSSSNSYFYTCEFITIICRTIGPIGTALLFLDAKPSPNWVFTRLRKK